MVNVYQSDQRWTVPYACSARVVFLGIAGSAVQSSASGAGRAPHPFPRPVSPPALARARPQPVQLDQSLLQLGGAPSNGERAKLICRTEEMRDETDTVYCTGTGSATGSATGWEGVEGRSVEMWT